MCLCTCAKKLMKLSHHRSGRTPHPHVSTTTACILSKGLSWVLQKQAMSPGFGCKWSFRAVLPGEAGQQ